MLRRKIVGACFATLLVMLLLAGCEAQPVEGKDAPSTAPSATKAPDSPSIPPVVSPTVTPRPTKNPADVVMFKDEGFEALIREKLGIPSGGVTAGDMAKIELLYGAYQDIKDISGIENCTRLKYLSLSGNQISDISPLSGLKSLTKLYLSFNPLSDITPLAKLKSLTELFLSFSQIGDISPLAGLESLTRLWLNGNQISDITPLSGLTSLADLYLSGNQISDLTPLEGLAPLEYLNLSGNKIGDLTPLSGLKSLYHISISDNPATDLSPVNHVGGVAGEESLTDSPGAQADLDALGGRWVAESGGLMQGGADVYTDIDIDGDGLNDSLELRDIDFSLVATLVLGSGVSYSVDTECMPWSGLEDFAIADLTGDGRYELIFSGNTGGNGGAGVHGVIALHVDGDGNINRLALPNRNGGGPYNAGYDFVITEKDGYTMDIASEMLDLRRIPIPQERIKWGEGENRYYENGRILVPLVSYSDGFYHFEVIRCGEGYALKLWQYVYGHDHADGVGDGISVLAWNGEELALAEQSFELY